MRQHMLAVWAAAALVAGKSCSGCFKLGHDGELLRSGDEFYHVSRVSSAVVAKKMPGTHFASAL